MDRVKKTPISRKAAYMRHSCAQIHNPHGMPVGILLIANRFRGLKIFRLVEAEVAKDVVAINGCQLL